MCHSSPEIIVCIKHNNIFHYCNKHKQEACENTSCGHKLLSACWCFSHLNSCRILSAQRASTRFTNLSPKSNKLPKHPSSRQPEREEKSWLSTSVFSFPSLWSTSAPLGVTAAAPCHPALPPPPPPPAWMSHWSSVKPKCPPEDTLPGMVQQLSFHCHSHHISHIEWPSASSSQSIVLMSSPVNSPVVLPPNFKCLALQHLHLQNIRGSLKRSVWQKPGSRRSKQQCLFSCSSAPSWLQSDAFVFQLVETAEGEINTTRPPHCCCHCVGSPQNEV